MNFYKKLFFFVVMMSFQTACVGQEEVVVYGVAKGSVTLPHNKWGGQRVSVLWTFGTSASSIATEVYYQSFSGTPRIGPKLAKRLSLSPGTPSLTIRELQDTDFGYYKLQLTEYSQNTHTIYRLYKIEVSSPQPSTLLATEDFSLKCVVDSSSARTVTTWFSPTDKELTPGGRISYSETESQLTVRNASRSDTGNWGCVVQYNQKSTTATHGITVVDLNAHSQVIYSSSISKSVLLPCSLSPGLTFKDVKNVGLQSGEWIFTPKTAKHPFTLTSLNLQEEKPTWSIPQNPKLNVSVIRDDNRNFSLIINQPPLENAGLYRCTLKFKNKLELQSTVDLRLLRVVRDVNATLYEGQDVNLTCTVDSILDPSFNVTWAPPRLSKAQLQEVRLTEGSRLTIRSTSEGDSGKWKCSLEKDGNTVISVALKLKIEKVPVDVWLVVLGCAAIFIFTCLIVIIVRLIRRYQQNRGFRRAKRRRTRYCRCEHPKPRGFYHT
ncbi:T-cell surface glycoprotein CD4-like isoform X2 [Lepisosteus oculatus]